MSKELYYKDTIRHSTPPFFNKNFNVKQLHFKSPFFYILQKLIFANLSIKISAFLTFVTVRLFA